MAAADRKKQTNKQKRTRLAMPNWLLCPHSAQPADSSLTAQGEPHVYTETTTKIYFVIGQL